MVEAAIIDRLLLSFTLFLVLKAFLDDVAAGLFAVSEATSSIVDCTGHLFCQTFAL